LHAAQEQGFFAYSGDNLYAAPVFIGYYQGTVAQPDRCGRMTREEQNELVLMPKRLDAELDLCRQTEREGHVAEALNVGGDVPSGRRCLIVTPVTPTGGSFEERWREHLKKAVAENAFTLL